MNLLDRIAAKLGYTKVVTTWTLEDSLARAEERRLAEMGLFDVALVMEDNDGNQSPTITCVMMLIDFLNLTDCWYTARSSEHPTATVCPIQKNGQRAYMGLMLDNVRALTAVPIVSVDTNKQGDV
jgi:hypothetical protein